MRLSVLKVQRFVPGWAVCMVVANSKCNGLYSALTDLPHGVGVQVADISGFEF